MSLTSPAPGRLAEAGAGIIVAAFDAERRRLAELTRAARHHFERADWVAMQRDHERRLDLYEDSVQEGLVRLKALLQDRVSDRATWTLMREAFAGRVAARPDVEIAQTFLNSVTRRVLHTVGVDPGVEFVTPAPEPPPAPPSPGLTVTFAREGPIEALALRILEHFRFAPGWDDATGDAHRLAGALIEQLGDSRVRAVELLSSVFFRGKGAYLVGRVHTDAVPLPVVIALHRNVGGVGVDAILVTENEVSIVFSFTRSYFFVETACPRELVAFLHGIMPRKPIAELYIAIGHNKHGKTELYRSLLQHLDGSDDRFEVAPGQRGMVMFVFTLPGFDVVFKVIRDRFEFPKTVTHQEVREKYRLVFRHDRAGRLVDVQEFEQLEFDRNRFTPEVLEELATSASESVELTGDKVAIRHVYTERRLRPLDVYLREAGPDAARDAVIDYGQVLRDLAATNIFPGDMLLKNFGVSRHGRLIFYDYDELCPLSECHFRTLPPARDDDEERSGEPWFYVGERDIFPEEFRSFLGLTGELLEVFLSHHGELLTADFWLAMQQRHAQGEILDIYPYRASRRLRPDAPGFPEQGAAS
jgi:isocitrate dehydrogenase kinase/phosphatase